MHASFSFWRFKLTALLDLENYQEIQTFHPLEAPQYRDMESRFFIC